MANAQLPAESTDTLPKANAKYLQLQNVNVSVFVSIAVTVAVAVTVTVCNSCTPLYTI